MRTPKLLTNAKTGQNYWEIRYRNPPGGPQRRMTFYVDPDAPDVARADAETFATLLQNLGPERAVAWWNQQLDADAPAQGPTVDEWWRRYIKATTGLTDGTRLTYERTYARVWSPVLGRKPVSAVTREDIAVAVNELSKTKADKTVKNHYGVIASCFKAAVEEGLIAATPCRKIRMPRRTEHTETEHRYLSNAEWARLHTALAELPEGHAHRRLRGHYIPLFTTLIGTGIRWGEAEALTVGDVLLDNYVEMPDGTLELAPMLRVNKAAKWNASKAERQIGPTKTKKSNRTVALPAEVVEVLEPLVKDRPSSDRLFTAPMGGPLRHATVYATWQEAVKRAGLTPAPRIHDLRHTHVAWLMARGVPLPVIQARLGHEKITTTVDTYGHLVPDLQVAAAQAASLAMRPRSTPKEIEP